MKKQYTILLDLDEVLNDLAAQWVKVLSARHNLTTTYEDLTQWDLEDTYPTLTTDEIYEPLYNKEFWRQLNPVPEATPYIQKWINKGYKIYIVTATDYEHAEVKMQWLFRYYPMFTWCDVILTQDKSMINGDVLVDDGLHNLLNGSFDKILLDKPWNRAPDVPNGIRRAHSWEDIDELIETIAKERNFD